MSDIAIGIIIGLAFLLIIAVGVLVYYVDQYRGAARLLDGALEDCGTLRLEADAEQAHADDLDAELDAALAANAALTKRLDTLADEMKALTARTKPFDPKHATPLQLLAQIVAAESGSLAPYTEARAIAQVVVNRAEASGKSIYDVLHEPGQFTPVMEGTWLWAKPDILESAAAYNALIGRTDAEPVPEDCIYFCSTKSSTTSEFFVSIARLRCAKYGDTVFYRAGK